MNGGLRFWLIGGVIVALTSMAGAAGLAWLKVRSQASQHTPPASTISATVAQRSLVLDLTDHHGTAVTAASLRGRYSLLYFGFTYCPDVCPTELGFLHRLLKALGDDAERISVCFITVDPERDTPAVLAEYVPHFDPRIRALSGTPEAIRAAADSVGAVYSRSTPASSEPGFYLINHSMSAFLIDPDGHPVATYHSGDGLETCLADLRQRLKGP